MSDDWMKRVAEVLRKELPDLHVSIVQQAVGSDRVLLSVVVKRATV